MKIVPFLLLTLFLACPGGNVTDGNFSLPEPVKSEKPIEECIRLRRSVRTFTEDTLTYEQISTLLWAAQGVTDTARGFRTAPSAGAKFPLETYVVINQGIFHYNPLQHEVNAIRIGNYIQQLSKACLNQSCVLGAPCSIIFCAVPERTAQKYGDRAMRYIYMEAGHAAQNVLLQAVALDLGGVPVGAFNDKALANLLDLDTYEEEVIPVYVISLGVPVSSPPSPDTE